MKKRRLPLDPEQAAQDEGESEAEKKHRALGPVQRCNLPLYVLRETLECACRHQCVSCAHKIAFGTDLPARSKPNIRPELCPRAKLSPESAPWSGIGLYPEGSRVLTIGDGDLSFSLSLVRRLGPGNVTVTTFESRDSIIRSYPETGRRNLKELQRLGCTPQLGVDAMDLEGTLDRGSNEELFDFIVFNFPCIATDVEGEDGQNQAMLENQTLLQLFGLGASRLLRPGTGQLHVSHKTKAAFKHWDVPGFVVKQTESLRPLFAAVFDRCAYPGYINRKARDRKSFPVTDAVVFVFGFPEATTGAAQQNTLYDGIETISDYLERMKPMHVLPCTATLVDGVIRSVLL